MNGKVTAMVLKGAFASPDEGVEKITAVTYDMRKVQRHVGNTFRCISRTEPAPKRTNLRRACKTRELQSKTGIVAPCRSTG